MEVSLGCFVAPWGAPGGASGRPRGVPGRPWRLPGVRGVLELLKRLGRLRGGFQGLMGRSWKRLGALLEASRGSLGPS